jgi:phosphatidylserine decarboxylase
MSIGHTPDTEPHKPDMKKDEASITMAERQEARRRIEGSLAPDMDPMGIMPGGADVEDESISAMHPANLQ